jgi:hypothetical protein
MHGVGSCVETMGGHAILLPCLHRGASCHPPPEFSVLESWH